MRVKTSELRIGDVVHDHGMTLLIDRPINSTEEARYGPVYWTKALVLNLEEVRAARIVPISWLFDHSPTEIRMDEPRWSIQGNDRASWNIADRP